MIGDDIYEACIVLMPNPDAKIQAYRPVFSENIELQTLNKSVTQNSNYF